MTTKNYQILISITIYFAFAASQLVGQNPGDAEKSTLVRWIDKEAIPVKYTAAGNAFSDLKPLKRVLKDTRVVGVGEATHGTREFFEFQHRMLEYLVEELGFNMFIMEASYAACKSINEYVLYGKGDRDAALTDQGYLAWDNETFTTLIEWMRAYNQKMPEHKKVSFHGVDLCFNGVGRALVLKYLEKHAPEEVEPIKDWFPILDHEEKRWPFNVDQAALEKVYPTLKGLMMRLERNKANLVAASSSPEYQEIYRHLRIMEQWVIVNAPNLVLPPGEERLKRGDYMGENFFYLMEQNPGAKCVFRAHNAHVSFDPKRLRSVGYFARERFGNQYYAMGINSSEGVFQYRYLLPDRNLSEFKHFTMLPVDSASLPGILSQSAHENLILDLRNTRRLIPPAQKFVQDTLREISFNWVLREDKWTENSYRNSVLQDSYDGILYIRRSSPPKPNRNALEIVGRKEGF